MTTQKTLHDLFILLGLERARRIDQRAPRFYQRCRGIEQARLTRGGSRKYPRLQSPARIGMAPHRPRRAARSVDEHGIEASGAQRRRLKIGSEALNRHSRAPNRLGKATETFVPSVTREHPRAPAGEG